MSDRVRLQRGERFIARLPRNFGQISVPRISALSTLAKYRGFTTSIAVWISKKTAQTFTETLPTSNPHLILPKHSDHLPHYTLPSPSQLVMITVYPARAHGMTSRDIPQPTPHYAIPIISPCVHAPTTSQRSHLGKNFSHDSAEDPQRFWRVGKYMDYAIGWNRWSGIYIHTPMQCIAAMCLQPHHIEMHDVKAIPQMTIVLPNSIVVTKCKVVRVSSYSRRCTVLICRVSQSINYVY